MIVCKKAMALLIFMTFSLDYVQSQCCYFEDDTCGWTTSEWKWSKDCVPDISKTPTFKEDGNFIALENQDGSLYTTEILVNLTAGFQFQYFYYSDVSGGSYMMSIYFVRNISESDSSLMEIVRANNTTVPKWETAFINCSQHLKCCENETCQGQVQFQAVLSKNSFIIIDNFEVVDQCDSSLKPVATSPSSKLCNELTTQLPTPTSTSNVEVRTPTSTTGGDEVSTPTNTSGGDEVATPTSTTSGDEVRTPTSTTGGEEVSTPTKTSGGDEVSTPTKTSGSDEVSTPTSTTGGDEVSTPTTNTSNSDDDKSDITFILVCVTLAIISVILIIVIAIGIYVYIRVPNTKDGRPIDENFGKYSPSNDPHMYHMNS